SEAVLIEISLYIVTSERMINPTQSSLDQHPEPFNCVRMDVAHYIDLLAVIDSVMYILIKVPVQCIVGREIICKHRALGQNVFLGHAQQSRAFHVSRNQCADAALALHHSDYGSFLVLKIASHRATDSSLAPSAVIRFIHLDAGTTFPAQRCILIQHCPNLLKPSPRGFVVD